MKTCKRCDTDLILGATYEGGHLCFDCQDARTPMVRQNPDGSLSYRVTRRTFDPTDWIAR